MPSNKRGCFSKEVLVTTLASAEGSAPGMDAAGCEAVCLNQQKTLAPGSTSALFNYFSIRPLAGECKCAPAMDAGVKELPELQCTSSSGTGVFLYELLQAGSSSSSSTSSASRSATATSGLPASATGNAGRSGSTVPSGGASSTSLPSTGGSQTADSASSAGGTVGESSAGAPVALIASLAVAALVFVIMGTMYIRQRRRNARSMAATAAMSSTSPGAGGLVVPRGSVTKGGPPGPPSGVLAPTAPPVAAYTSDRRPSAAQPIMQHQQQTVIVPFAAPTTVTASGKDLASLPVVPEAEVLANGVVADPARQYRVQQGYQPTLDDELALVVGELVVVLEMYDDGWCLGRVTAAHRQGAPEGVFPHEALLPSLDDPVVAAAAVPLDGHQARPVRLPQAAAPSSASPPGGYGPMGAALLQQSHQAPPTWTDPQQQQHGLHPSAAAAAGGPGFVALTGYQERRSSRLFGSLPRTH
ncbi:fus1 actin binding activity protein [Blastocladiella emersonii ATCC 22665]|nr:fus1 actin binding activity protein [Blastocladiella emersonii ATCC 22665]